MANNMFAPTPGIWDTMFYPEETEAKETEAKETEAKETETKETQNQ